MKGGVCVCLQIASLVLKNSVIILIQATNPTLSLGLCSFSLDYREMRQARKENVFYLAGSLPPPRLVGPRPPIDPPPFQPPPRPTSAFSLLFSSLLYVVLPGSLDLGRPWTSILPATTMPTSAFSLLLVALLPHSLMAHKKIVS